MKRIFFYKVGKRKSIICAHLRSTCEIRIHNSVLKGTKGREKISCQGNRERNLCESQGGRNESEEKRKADDTVYNRQLSENKKKAK